MPHSVLIADNITHHNITKLSAIMAIAKNILMVESVRLRVCYTCAAC